MAFDRKHLFGMAEAIISVKSWVSSYFVKSVNNQYPDSNGNVQISVGNTDIPDIDYPVTGVKGGVESSYRLGNVNLTCANIGAATSGHTHSQYLTSHQTCVTSYNGTTGAVSGASSVKLNGVTYEPNTAGMIELGYITSGGDVYNTIGVSSITVNGEQKTVSGGTINIGTFSVPGHTHVSNLTAASAPLDTIKFANSTTATNTLALWRLVTDTNLGNVITDFYAHDQNGDRHVSTTNKTYWNSKADGTHTHTEGSTSIAINFIGTDTNTNTLGSMKNKITYRYWLNTSTCRCIRYK